MLPSFHSLRISDLARQTTQTDGSFDSLLVRTEGTSDGDLKRQEEALRKSWKWGKQRLKDAKGEEIQQIITLLRSFADPSGLGAEDISRANDFAKKWCKAVASNMAKKATYYRQKAKTTALEIAREQDGIIERSELAGLTMQERLGLKEVMHPVKRFQVIHDAHGLRPADRKAMELLMKRMVGRAQEPSGRGTAGGSDQLYLGSDQYGNVRADSTVVNPVFKGEELGVSDIMGKLIAQQVVQEALSQRCALHGKEAEGWAKDEDELKDHARSLALALDNLRTTFHRETTLLSEVAKTVYTFVQSGGNTDGLLPHIALMGEPGIGKTLLAQLLARLLSELGVLMYTTHANVTVTDFVAQYLGQTAPKTEKLLEENLERVVFFDEAYALTRNVQPQTRDGKAGADGAGGDSSDNLYGQEAIDKLVPFLWDERGRMIMIVAGYQDQIEKQFLQTNIGLQSRFQLQIVLNPYPAPQMVEIYLKSLARGFRFPADTGLRTAFNMFSYSARYLLQAIVEKARQWTVTGSSGGAVDARNLPLPAAAPPAAAAAGPSTSSGVMVGTDGSSDGEGEDADAVGSGSGGADAASAHRKSTDMYARRMPAHCDRSYKHLYRLFEAHGRSMDSLAAQTRKLVEQSLAQEGEGSELYANVYLTDVHVLEIFDSQIDAMLGNGDSDTTEVALNTGTDSGMLTNAAAARFELRRLLNELELIRAVEDDHQVDDVFALKEESAWPPFQRHMTTVLLGEGTEQLQGSGYTGSMAASDARSQEDAFLREKYPADFGVKAYFESRRRNPKYVDRRTYYTKNTLWWQVWPIWDKERKLRASLITGREHPLEFTGPDKNWQPLGDFEVWVRREYPWADSDTPMVTEEEYETEAADNEEAAQPLRQLLDAVQAVSGHGKSAAERKRARSALEAEQDRLAVTPLQGGAGMPGPAGPEHGHQLRSRSVTAPGAQEERFRSMAEREGFLGALRPSSSASARLQSN